MKFKVIEAKNSAEWNRYVQSIEKWDIYYLCEYLKSLEIHGDGEPLLFLGISPNGLICYAAMKRDIACDPVFQNILPMKRYYDLETPYGYGGLLADKHVSKDELETFFQLLTDYCMQHNVVSQFYRFNPLLNNHLLTSAESNIITSKQSIFIDTTSEQLIYDNIVSKNRNMIRKASKHGVEIFHDKGEKLEDFISIYESTMRKNNANEYYYFKKDYFNYLLKNMNNNMEFFYALYNNEIISSSIILFNDNFMHYHLSGTLEQYKYLASTNLLLYEAAIWGCKKGISKFHLGGGVDALDGLFGFKKQFNRNGKLDFYVGRTIFMKDTYEELLHIRKEIDSTFVMNNNRLIQYRG